MKIYLNGEEVETMAITVDQLIEEKRLDVKGLVVEVNLTIVKKEDWGKAGLDEDDRIEIVTFVGGG